MSDGSSRARLEKLIGFVTVSRDSNLDMIEFIRQMIGRLEEIGEQLAQPEHHDERFDPPFSTVQTGVIKGGRALNIVPAECEFDFEVRALLGFDAHQVADEFRPVPRAICEKQTCYVLAPKCARQIASGYYESVVDLSRRHQYNCGPPLDFEYHHCMTGA